MTRCTCGHNERSHLMTIDQLDNVWFRGACQPMCCTCPEFVECWPNPPRPTG